MNEISKNKISLRKLKLEDAKLIFEWRNDETIIRLSSSQKKVSWQEHHEWIKNSIQNPVRKVFIIENNEEAVGQVRFDKENENDNFASISIYLLSQNTKKGIGTRALQLACQKYFEEESSIKEIFAFVRNENEISQKFFLKGNFEKNNQKSISQHQTFKLNPFSVKKKQLQQDLKKNIDFYSNLVEKHGLDVKSLNWGSKQSQELRFKILSELTDLNNKSVVDIGCGLGDFYGWLQSNNIDTNYTGTDITPKMIEKAQERFPKITFEVNNILTKNFSYTPDCIIASGIFAYQNQSFLEEFITKSFDKVKHSLAFNSLSSLANDKDENEFYPNPLEVLIFCQKITPWVTLRQDYHSRDFTIYMYKERNT